MTETRMSLLDRVRNPQDADGWSEFVRLYEPLLFSYARRMGMETNDAADLIQEVFIKLVQTMPRFDLDRSRGRFRTWLYGILKNAVIDRARKRRRECEADEAARNEWSDIETTASSDSEERFLAEHRQRVMEFVLGKVREATRPNTWTCFEQHILRGRSAAEVGAELGLSTNVVYVNASRVMAKVRDQCAEHMEALCDGS